MPTVQVDWGWRVVDESIEWPTTNIVDDSGCNAIDEGPEIVAIHEWDDAITWCYGNEKPLPKDLKELLGEPDWEI